ncbi:MAG: PTS sugar transporter subunit IIA [Erysipelotrichaceae bacterium]
MFSIVLASHGGFAKGLLEAVEFIAGKQEKISTYGLYLGDDIEQFSADLSKEIHDKLDDEGVLVLTDLVSGSPFNATVGAMDDERIIHFTGMNMAMLLTVVCQRPYMDLQQIAQTLLQESKSGMLNVNELLASLQEDEEE